MILSYLPQTTDYSNRYDENCDSLATRGKHLGDVACGFTNIRGIRGEESALRMLTLGATSLFLLHFSADMGSVGRNAPEPRARAAERERRGEGR